MVRIRSSSNPPPLRFFPLLIRILLVKLFLFVVATNDLLNAGLCFDGSITSMGFYVLPFLGPAYRLFLASRWLFAAQLLQISVDSHRLPHESHTG